MMMRKDGAFVHRCLKNNQKKIKFLLAVTSKSFGLIYCNNKNILRVISKKTNLNIL
jgi:hypothetical protein